LAASYFVNLVVKQIEFLFARGFCGVERGMFCKQCCNWRKFFRYSSSCSSARANESSRLNCFSGESKVGDRAGHEDRLDRRRDFSDRQCRWRTVDELRVPALAEKLRLK